MLPGPPGPLLAMIVLCLAHLGRMESGGIGLDQMDKMKTMTLEIMEDIGATQLNSCRIAALLRACLVVVPRAHGHQQACPKYGNWLQKRTWTS